MNIHSDWRNIVKSANFVTLCISEHSEKIGIKNPLNRSRILQYFLDLLHLSYLPYFQMLQARSAVHDVIRSPIATFKPIFSLDPDRISRDGISWLNARVAVTDALFCWYQKLRLPFGDGNCSDKVLKATRNKLVLSFVLKSSTINQ